MNERQKKALAWLRRGWRLNEEIKALEDTKENLYDIITSATACGGGDSVQSPQNPHRFDEFAALSDQIDERIAQLISFCVDTLAIAQQIDDQRLRVLLVKRYTQFKSFEQIAVEMNYEWRHIMRLHGQALDKVGKFIMSYNVI